MKYTDFLSDRLIGRTFYRRGTGKPATLRRTFLFGLRGESPTTHVVYYEEGDPRSRMVTVRAFCDMFAETPMVPAAEPPRPKTAEKYKSQDHIREYLGGLRQK